MKEEKPKIAVKWKVPGTAYEVPDSAREWEGESDFEMIGMDGTRRKNNRKRITRDRWEEGENMKGETTATEHKSKSIFRNFGNRLVWFTDEP